jgi:carbamoyltransferase
VSYILGINAYHAGASVCLLRDGMVIGAAEEERFNRQKYWAGFPTLAARWVLSDAGITPADLDHIGISRDPGAHLAKKLRFALRHRPSMRLLLDRVRNATSVRDPRAMLAAALGIEVSALRAQLHNVEHHRAHMASAFFASPFDRAAVVSIDGMGDFVSTMWGTGCGNALHVHDRINFPHSLGFFYTAISQWLGFRKYGDEGKVMGLAPYGRPTRVEDLRKVLKIAADGTFELNLDYFVVHTEGATMSWEDGQPTLGHLFSPRLEALLGPARSTSEPLTGVHHDVASSLQALLEEAVFAQLNVLHARTGVTDVCLAGGVALNSAANGQIPLRTPFSRVFVQPAAGDAGTAMGVCLHIWHERLGMSRGYVMQSAALGPKYDSDTIESTLRRRGHAFRNLDSADLAAQVAERLARGEIVGWFQGRMEWGPRALGNRSILADPRRAEMKDVLNARIKHREAFRPFAPSILEEQTGDYFEQRRPDPFMVNVYKVRPEMQAVIPAVTHVDGTGRLQTVSRDHAPEYWQLIEAFRQRSGVPVVLNTSFNDNEPIVCSPDDAVDCYERTRMDALALGSCLVSRQS